MWVSNCAVHLSSKQLIIEKNLGSVDYIHVQDAANAHPVSAYIPSTLHRISDDGIAYKKDVRKPRSQSLRSELKLIVLMQEMVLKVLTRGEFMLDPSKETLPHQNGAFCPTSF